VSLGTPAGEPVTTVCLRSVTVLRSGARALDAASIDVRAGDRVVVLGGNGAGKSLLLRTVAGLERIFAGSVDLFGQRLSGRGEGLPDDIGMRVGAVLQRAPLLADLTIRENLEFSHRVRAGARRRDLDATLTNALVRFELEAYRDLFPASLSAGLTKRAEIARALIHDPELLLLDDPFSGVDDEAADDIERIVTGATSIAGGRTLLLTTVDRERAFRIATKLARIDTGRLSPAEAR
jgi:phospholipid/cholesterol/gamma-HCH transport system ATP-binding protein